MKPKSIVDYNFMDHRMSLTLLKFEAKCSVGYSLMDLRMSLHWMDWQGRDIPYKWNGKENLYIGMSVCFLPFVQQPVS